MRSISPLEDQNRLEELHRKRQSRKLKDCLGNYNKITKRKPNSMSCHDVKRLLSIAEYNSSIFCNGRD